MTTKDFCYWLQGHLELNPSASITDGQRQMIRVRLDATLMTHADSTIKVSDVLQTIHDNNKKIVIDEPPFNN